MTGKIASIFRHEEYAIIDPDSGGPGVFVDADEFGQDWNALRPGIVVRFCYLQGAQGLRAYNVTFPGRELSETSIRGEVRANPPVRSRPGGKPVLKAVSQPTYENLIAEVLTSTIPEMTSVQISAVCRRLSQYAYSRRWLAAS